MKKLLKLLFVVIITSCSSSDGEMVDETLIQNFTEPFFVYEAPKSQIESRYGNDYQTEPNNFSLGYKMKYSASENGVISYLFSLDNQETLWETEVLFHSGQENVNYLRQFFENNYTETSDNTNGGLTVVRYENSSVEVELRYLSGSNSGITVIYGDNF